jgi:predicted Zn-ribbon and HTH transcriptional regulator
MTTTAKGMRTLGEVLTDAGIDLAARKNCKLGAEVLDWPLIEPPVCEECKGQGSTPKGYGDDRDKGRTFSTCPTCHGTGYTGPTFVVTRDVADAAMDAADAACGAYRATNQTKPATVREAVFYAIASALLGHVERSSAVGKMESQGPHDHTWWVTDREAGGKCIRSWTLHNGDRVAVLEARK